MSNNTPPELDQPLIYEPAQTIPPTPTKALGPLEHLVGTWTNQNIHGSAKRGIQAPYSYNVMSINHVL